MCAWGEIEYIFTMQFGIKLIGLKKIRNWGLKRGSTIGIITPLLGWNFSKIFKMNSMWASETCLHLEFSKNTLLFLLNGWKLAYFKFFIFWNFNIWVTNTFHVWLGWRIEPTWWDVSYGVQLWIWLLTNVEREWLDSLEPSHIWGIMHIPCHKCFLTSLMEHWCDHTNMFHLPIGKISITLTNIHRIL